MTRRSRWSASSITGLRSGFSTSVNPAEGVLDHVVEPLGGDEFHAVRAGREGETS